MSEPSNPAKVKVYGPGVEKGVKTFTPTHFIVDCKAAGPGKLVFIMFGLGQISHSYFKSDIKSVFKER